MFNINFTFFIEFPLRNAITSLKINMGNQQFTCHPPVIDTPGEVVHSHADIIFTGGTILTMTDCNPTVDTIAVKDHKIVALGKKEEIFQQYKGFLTKVVELQGTETLMPGLIEPHTHPSLVSSFAPMIDLSGYSGELKNKDDVLAKIKKAVEAMKSKDTSKWLVFKGWDPAIITDLPSIDAKTLDVIATKDYPVFVIEQALHSGWLNTKGLEVCGITKDTPNPKGGIFVKDSRGCPTGMVKEGPAVGYVLMKIPNLPLATLTDIFPALNQYAENGFTTITDMGTIPIDILSLSFLSFVTLWPSCPVRIGVFCNPVITKEKPNDFFTNEKLWFPGAKVWADGSPYAGSMATKQPYLDTKMTRALDFDEKRYPCGYLIYPCLEDQVNVLRPFKNEILATHCQGERAIDHSLDTYKKLIDENPTLKDHRYRLDHCCLITEEQLLRATDLGVTVTMFVDHVYYYGIALKEGIVGTERAERFVPTALATKCGQTHWTLHADSPFNPINPFRSMHTCITRRTMKDPSVVLGPQYRSSIDDALKAYTINAAWQLKRENEIGSIEVGKLADLVLLSNNPKSVPVDDLLSIQVLETYVGGKVFDHRK